MNKQLRHIDKISNGGLIALLLCFFACAEKNHNNNGGAEGYPSISLTYQGVQKIKKQLGHLPILDHSLDVVKQEIDQEMALGIQVPVPKDLAGGYTHERHKRNFFVLQKAGVLYQITEDERYASFVKEMLMAYADLYPTLDLHPATKSYAPGKLFWQCLNDANWLVYVSQAYDCIYDYLKQSEREQLENDLFRPYADFLSTGNPRFFNRIHNHSTWGNAAVGMIGLVMKDEELIDRALYGLKSDGISEKEKDNDGGLIKIPGQDQAGFLANLEHPFSPDGYYTEGPYYQRYAMYPFLVFAQALENVKPELGIFAYKDSVLVKAVYALLNLTDQSGQFFPLNDAQKGMSYLSRELITSVNLAYHFGGKDPELLSIAREQGTVLLEDSGLSVAEGLANNLDRPFVKKSIELRDGPDGNQGGIGILRQGRIGDETCLVMKYSAHGLSHGHFDKLSFSLYDNDQEVVEDYGLARFVNIEQKNGGGYLPENTSWAKQTIAHNTLVVNETSHFKAHYRTANSHHSEKYYFRADENMQLASAKEYNAYPGIEMHRTMAMVTDEQFDKPLVIDVFRVNSSIENQYDLPYYFGGQLLSTNFSYDAPATLEPLGESFGYQHLWQEANGHPEGENVNLTWLHHGRFYSITALIEPEDEVLFTRLGANDPEYNLRRTSGLVLRKNHSKNAIFVSIIESHGSYDPVSETASNAFSSISKVSLLHNEKDYSAIGFEHTGGTNWVLLMSNEDNGETRNHQLSIVNEKYSWQGPFQFMKN